MKKVFLCSVMAAVVVISSGTTVRAEEGFSFRVGLAVASGIADVADTLEDSYNATHRHTQADVTAIPIGLVLGATHKAPFGGRADVVFGPAVVTLGDIEYYDIPFAFTYGYGMPINAKVGIYARGGIAIHIVSGDFDAESTPGVVGAVGVEFFKDRKVQMGVELGVDTTKVEFFNGAVEEDAHGVVLSAFALI